MARAGVRPTDLANMFGCTRQNLNTKFTRGSWSDADLARVAEFTGGKLMFVYPDGQQILIDASEVNDPIAGNTAPTP